MPAALPLVIAPVDSQPPAVGIPLGLQFIFTNLACSSFADAMVTHPAAKGGVRVDIVTRDPKKTEGAPESYVHTAIKLPNGHILDAEGVRPFAVLCRDFGMSPRLSEFVTKPVQTQECDDDLSVGIRRLVNLCGWEAGAPLSTTIETATGNWKEAEDDFDALGGMCEEPFTTLNNAIDRIERTKLRTAPQVLNYLVAKWIADPEIRAMFKVTCAWDITQGPCVDFAEEAEELMRDVLGPDADIEIMHSDDVAKEDGLSIGGYHAFLRVGDRYYDSQERDGVYDPWMLPFMRQEKRHAEALESDPSEDEAVDGDMDDKDVDEPVTVKI